VQGGLWLQRGLPWLCLVHHVSFHVRKTFDTRAASFSSHKALISAAFSNVEHRGQIRLLSSGGLEVLGLGVNRIY
jgi:hypothetical protein